jgi:hypothetical protein
MSRMKIFSSLFFSLLICVACSSETESATETTSNEGGITQDSLVQNVEKSKFNPENIFDAPIVDEFEFKGDLVSAYWWEDENHANYLINSILRTEDEEGWPSAYLFSYHYTKVDTIIKLLRLVQDFEESCDFDITLEFLGKPSITDLNGDNVAEVAIIYRKACRSDVSECAMKLIMHDDENKYALRGSQYIVFPDDQQPTNYQYDLSKADKDDDIPEWLDFRGRYENAKDFEGADASFLTLADSIWRSNAFERFD